MHILTFELFILKAAKKHIKKIIQLF